MIRPTSPPVSLRSMADDETDADERRDEARALLLRGRFFAEPVPAGIASIASAVPSGMGATVGAKRPHQKASRRKAEASAAGFHGSTIGSGSAGPVRSPQRRPDIEDRGAGAGPAATQRTRPDSEISTGRPSRTPCGDAAAARFVACCEDDRSGALHDSARMSRGGRSRASGEARCGDARPQSRRTPPPSRRPGRAS